VYQSRLHGRGQDLPRVFGIFFLAGTLGLAGLPPLGAFPGKALVEDAAVEVGYGWTAAVFLLATALTVAALLRAGARVFLGWGPACVPASDPREPPTEESELTGSRGRVPWPMFASGAVLIGAGLIVGAVPGAVDNAQRSAQVFADRSVYAAAVLGRPVPTPEPIHFLHTGALSWALAVVTVVAALGLTAILLERVRLPFRIPPAVQRAAKRSFTRLRRQHSGQIGDYVAWATVGFALIGALFAAAT
jgi:multicomponent Na+:H+ antiporter subunit D